jgi:hypothetical protein
VGASNEPLVEVNADLLAEAEAADVNHQDAGPPGIGKSKGAPSHQLRPAAAISRRPTREAKRAEDADKTAIKPVPVPPKGNR